MTENIIPISFPPVYGERIEQNYPNVRMTIEHITPDVAEKMLETNIANRDINDTSIVFTVLRDDEWELNGATIVFDEDGILRDGQHRLYACMKVGKPIDTVVVRGVKADSQITMDTGTKRKLRDYTKMHGYKDYSTVATIGLALYIVDKYGLETYAISHRGGKATYKAVIKFIDDNHPTRIEPLVSDVRAIQKRYKHLNVGNMGAVLDAFKKAGDDNYQEFIDQLLNRHPACVSIRLLQEALLKNSNETNRAKRLTEKYLLAYTIKAWNAYMRGDDIKQLKFTQGGAHPENFPEVFLGYE